MREEKAAPEGRLFVIGLDMEGRTAEDIAADAVERITCLLFRYLTRSICL